MTPDRKASEHQSRASSVGINFSPYYLKGDAVLKMDFGQEVLILTPGYIRDVIWKLYVHS